MRLRAQPQIRGARVERLTASPPACCGTAEVKPDRKRVRRRRRECAGSVANRRQQFACRMWIRAARALRDGGGEAGGRKARIWCGRGTTASRVR
jgi:hypothetical protein